MSDVGGRRSEVGGRRSGVGGRRSEVGGRMSEVGGRRAKGGGRRSDVGCRRSEVGGRRSEVGGRGSGVGGRGSGVRGRSHLPGDDAARLAGHPAVELPRVEGGPVGVLRLVTHHLLHDARVADVYLQQRAQLLLEQPPVLVVVLRLATEAPTTAQFQFRFPLFAVCRVIQTHTIHNTAIFASGEQSVIMM